MSALRLYVNVTEPDLIQLTDGEVRAILDSAETAGTITKESRRIAARIPLGLVTETTLYGEGKTDYVNHPPHYTSDPSGVECITITRHRNFNIGNAIKYLWRAGLGRVGEGQDSKDKQIEDLEKAVFYIRDEIERIRG